MRLCVTNSNTYVPHLRFVKDTINRIIARVSTNRELRFAIIIYQDVLVLLNFYG